MATFQTLYSGSSGNCTVIRDGHTALLVDMGKSCRATLSALYSLGLSASSLSGILITHEHSDHVNGLLTFLKHYDVPLFANSRTLSRLRGCRLIPESCCANEIHEGEPFELDGVRVECFHTDHDSAACVGYRFGFSDGSAAAVATDLGRVSGGVLEALRGCSLVALESNYDDAKLMMGRYPMYLKNRIASDVGHLSNLDCSAALARLAAEDDASFVLMHLSEENNAPQIALTTCYGVMENFGVSSPSVCVAPRHTPSEEIAVRAAVKC